MFSHETISRVIHENKRQKGNIGEDIACKFLEKNGFSITDRNYQKKWGELDIIATKQGIIHFFEVKSVTDKLAGKSSDIHRPEDNIHQHKIHHIRRMIQTYLADKGGGLETEFHFHVLSVYMDMDTRHARVKWLKDIIL